MQHKLAQICNYQMNWVHFLAKIDIANCVKNFFPQQILSYFYGKQCLMNIWAKFQLDLMSLTRVFNQKEKETQNFDLSIFC